MNIEVGKWYKTRDGRKAYVAFRVDRPLGPDDEFAGFVCGPKFDVVQSWAADGHYCPTGEEDACDLVAEWRDASNA